jgi:hypothetical protein
MERDPHGEAVPELVKDGDKDGAEVREGWGVRDRALARVENVSAPSVERPSRISQLSLVFKLAARVAEQKW